MDPIKAAFGDLYNALEVVEADLNQEESLTAACAGSTYVVHTASPFYYHNKTEEELIKPAVDGTMAVMRACKAHGVKRCVITSSGGAIKYGYNLDDPESPEGR